MNILTVDGASPLFIAAQEGLVDCMNTLLAAGDFFLSAITHCYTCNQ